YDGQCLRGVTLLKHVFFFQAEDGIRDKLVTGVQTCALPISGRAGAEIFSINEQSSAAHRRSQIRKTSFHRSDLVTSARSARQPRSEERRVGKECRTWGWQ